MGRRGKDARVISLEQSLILPVRVDGGALGEAQSTRGPAGPAGGRAVRQPRAALRPSGASPL
eukprot:456636-Pyramimonas_sp.AAC.1